MKLHRLTESDNLKTVKLTFYNSIGWRNSCVLVFDCTYEPRHEKTCLCHMQTTKAQISLRIRLRLISAFVVRYLDRITHLVVIFEISRLQLACVPEQAGLSYLVANPEDRFLHGDALLQTYVVVPRVVPSIIKTRQWPRLASKQYAALTTDSQQSHNQPLM